ncbi:MULTISPECIES: DUF2247 family protein [Morganellaceae]|uniref:DUF2247 family protein n=1 Tax=Xenorhabdus griffiniae TaxID=351672 RepID=A0ABY9XMP3_9GAMM|nr:MULTISPECIES: DUF2247 family protein [Morganellaceae]PQQ22303.1 DUF2247 domain-containing protein [Photorhabdus luminescens]MBD1226991.1 DUF2247 family protein [Xenorhabdus griffiniae]MBE8586119.1 DUF2247 family protein [Xenorhabdus griffiniae]MBS9424522.1 DUF2247 family protein [Photorhabdus caribbeanensis]WMV74222.1 DUF2247 family protein [Xenorhabdus griffiniae]
MMNDMYLLAKKMELLDWGMIFLGAKGNPVGRLSAPNISEFACNELTKLDLSDSILVEVSEAAFCTEINREVIDSLEVICDKKNINIQLSERKWRYVALYILLLNELPDDYVYGLLKLNEFWNLWGDSVDSPNIVQGVGNNLSPTEYYSDENYHLLIEKHRNWLDREIKQLQ